MRTFPCRREKRFRPGWPIHAGIYFLQAVEKGDPVYHNDEYLQGSSVWIKSGDTTRIGNTLLHWTLSGDRVEVRIQGAGEVSLTPPPIDPLAMGDRKNKQLPRVNGTAHRPGKTRRWLAVGLLFLLLVLVAVFVLTAQRVHLIIQPEPDRLTISGFPPVLKVEENVLALNGTYTVQADKAGFQPLSQQIVVAAGRTSFNFTLEKLPGRVDVVSQPVAGASVFVDDNPLGTTPLNGVEIGAGSHWLRVEKERYLPLEQQLVVTGGGEQQSVDVQLQPGWGTVTLASDPAGATVSQGEQILGTTPLVVELMAGEALLHLSKEGFSPAELQLAVVSGQQAAPEPIRLEPAPATVSFRSVPAGAMVSIGDTFSGTTPVTLSLPSTVQQEIRLQLSGYAPALMRRSFVAGALEDVSVTLQPVYGLILLSTDPVDATLFIDGKKHGPATGRLRLTTREHRLTIQAEGFTTVTRTVLPKKGVSQQLEIVLVKKGAPAASVSSSQQPANNGRFIALGPATVQMGAGRREPGRRANEQQRTVQLSRPFLLAVHPVTNAEFRRFRPGHRSGSLGTLTLDGDRQPVVNVSWDDAARYCNWLSGQEGLPEFYQEQSGIMVTVSPANTGYRLATEAEWAFAAGMAGRRQRARYPWAGKFPPSSLSGNFGDESARSLLPVVIRGYNDGFSVTAPVGSFPKNPAGFFDMGGNVSQWCHDWYTPYTGLGEQKTSVDSMGPGSGTHHVVRGSSWRDATMTILRFSYRGYGKTTKDDIGFRVARYRQ